MLRNIPCIYNDNALIALTMPNIMITQQCWWLLLLSRLKAVKFLIDVGGETGISYNRELINTLKLDLKILNTQNILQPMLRDDTYKEYYKLIVDILNI